MESRHRHAFPLFVCIAIVFTVLSTSCSNAQQKYDKGKYSEAIRQIDNTRNPDADDLLLKAKSFIALGQEEKALESLFLYLSLADDSSTEGRSFAVSHFLEVNTSDKLAIMVLSPSDGTEAQKALFLAYSREGNTEKASEMLDLLSLTLGFRDYVSLMLSAPHDIQYILDIFTAWYGTINDSDKDVYLSLLDRFSNEVAIPENEAKRFLSLTDLLMTDSYYTDDGIKLSRLLKIKGNILEMLFDKVNARIYWSQALRLNPDDEQLKERLK